MQAYEILQIIKNFKDTYPNKEIDFSKAKSTIQNKINDNKTLSANDIKIISAIKKSISNIYHDYDKNFEKDDIEILMSTEENNNWIFAFDTNNKEWFYSDNGYDLLSSMIDDKKKKNYKIQYNDEINDDKHDKMFSHALDQIVKYAEYQKFNINTNSTINTYNGSLNNPQWIDKYKDKISEFYNNQNYNTDNIEIIVSDFDDEQWFIAIDTKNKNYFYSLDGENILDEKTVNYLTKPPIEWSKIDKNTKLKFGTRIAGMPKALKKYIFNPKSKFNPKYHVDNAYKVHNIKKKVK